MSSRAGFGLFGFRCSTKGTASKRRRGKTPKGFFSLLSVAPVNNSLPKGFMTADRYKNPMFSRVRSTFRAFDKNGVFDQTGIDSKGLSVFTRPILGGLLTKLTKGKRVYRRPGRVSGRTAWGQTAGDLEGFWGSTPAREGWSLHGGLAGCRP